MQQASDLTFSFYDPRFNMTALGRFLVRVGSFLGILFLIVLAIVLLLSDLVSLRIAGIIMALFLLDRARCSGKGDCSIRDIKKSGEVNIARFLSARSFSALERSFERSGIERSNMFIAAAYHLAEIKEIKEGLSRLEIGSEEFRSRCKALYKAGQSEESREERRKKIADLVLLAFDRARAMRHEYIEPTDIFSSLPLVRDESISQLFNVFSVSSEDISRAVLFGELSRKFSLRRRPSSLGGFAHTTQRKLRHRVMNRAWTARPTPTLDAFGTDYTDLARAGATGFLIGHDSEFQRLADVLSRTINPNAILVGDPGSGKEAIIAHLASRLVKDEVPETLFDKRLVGIDISLIVAGSTPEELHERIKRIAFEIIDAGNVILYIPDFHNLVRTSSAAFLSIADAFVPIFAGNAFPVIGSTYPREYTALVEQRTDLAGLFETIRIEEISENDAATVLVHSAMILEGEFGVRITLGAIKSAVALAKKYLHNKLLPGSADELLKSALAGSQRRKSEVLRHEDVVEALEARVKVPVHEVKGEEAEKLLHIEETIHKRLVDQEEAVKAVSDALREYRSGLSRKGGPIASFLFVGPTGVGKTELAKTLAYVEFGSENLMVRFDMTEYQDPQSIRRFIGAPDGSIEGALTRTVAERPYCVILLDEFEKTHSTIQDLFLQVFEDGRLTDSIGRTISFENTIIIATSNAHSDIINDSLRQGQTMANISEYLKSRLTDVFKPELINRFSRVVIFKNLNPDDLKKIGALQLNDLKLALEKQGISFGFEESAVDLLIKLGYEPAFGARPLRRVLEEKIRAPLSKELLKGSVTRGGSVRILAEGGEFKFTFASENPRRESGG